MDENNRHFSAYDRLLQSPVNESRFDAENMIQDAKASDRSCWKGTILVIVAICALASVFIALAFLVHFPYPPTLFFEWNYGYRNCSGHGDPIARGHSYCRTNPYPITDLPYFVCSGDSVLVYNCTAYIMSHNDTCPPSPTRANHDRIHEQPYYLPSSLDADSSSSGDGAGVSESACTLWEVARQGTCFRLTDRFGASGIFNVTCVNGTSNMWPILEPVSKLGLFITACVLYGIAVLTALVLFIVMLFARYSTWPDLERFVSEPALVEWSKHAYLQQEWDYFKEDEFGPNGKARVKYNLAWLVKKGGGFVFLSAVIVISIYCRGTVPDSLIPGLSFFVSCLVIGLGTALLFLLFWIAMEPIVFEIKRRRNLEPLHFKITALGYYWGQFYSVSNSCANSRRWEAIRMTGSAETQLCIEICTSIEGKHSRHNHIYKIPVPRSCIDSANQFILNFQAQGLHPTNQFNASVWDS